MSSITVQERVTSVTSSSEDAETTYSANDSLLQEYRSPNQTRRVWKRRFNRHPLLAGVLRSAAAIQAEKPRRTRALLEWLLSRSSARGTSTQRLARQFSRGLLARL